MDPLLKNLTAPQREAVQHVDGPLLILAGPGSGKTRVVTHRVAHLLRSGVSARQILALTFTNKAADEMKTRVAALAPDRPVWISTFHRFCSRLLREHAAMVGLGQNFTIYDTSDSQSALKRAIERLDFDSTHYTPQRLAAAISWAKNNLIGPEQYEARSGSPLASIVARVYPAYQAELLKSNAVDFDDLLLHSAILLKENPEVRASLDARYRQIMVDEYQDTNLAQYTIVRALSLDEPNLAVTGDPDQSIYGWRGANLNNILEFERDYPDVRVVRLEQNYRSTKRILRVADRLIAHNRRRKEKELFTENEEGAAVSLVTYGTQKDEAEAIAARIAELVNAGRYHPRDIAVFYRINALSRALEFALRDHGIPYQIIRGVEFYQRKEIKDVLAYLQLVNNPRDNTAFLRVVNTPPRGIGKTTIERLSQHAARYSTTLLEAAREAGLIEDLAKNKKAVAALAKFVEFFDQLSQLAAQPVEEVLGHVLEESGYHDFLKQSDEEEDQERLANIEELLTAAREFDERNPEPGALEAFLEQASLVNDTDDWDAVQDRVTLMTLHASKGLEFPVVFITAVEEGLIPHERSRDNPDDLEEERRLLFVGITRAEKELRLSRAVYRSFRGRTVMSVPSMFLVELPIEEMDVGEQGVMALPSMAWDRPTPWNDEPGHDDVHESDDDLSFPPVTAAASPPSHASTAPAATPLTTAAELALGGAAGLPPVSPEDFFAGMLVRHPEYGLGKIIALSGQRSGRKATVAFTSAAGQRTFVLAQSPLRPVK
ncbi:MAG TPA: UvrD-helicase domain-containing protein [Pirellulales bacterium]|jgi:DNA helicase-2/ATP-dependent DNA helicase PcrA|nr:UvrD-helicase domain-containing protein [Pirellulales bacterium]